MNVKAYLTPRRKKVIVYVLMAVVLLLALPRLRAEYCYLGIVLTDGDVNWSTHFVHDGVLHQIVHIGELLTISSIDHVIKTLGFAEH